MFDSCVLGVDPGVASVGLAVLGRAGSGTPSILWSHTLKTLADTPEETRLQIIHAAVRDALAAHHPDTLAIERLMWGKNVGSAMKVSRASGVIMLAAAEGGVSVAEYAPLEVKMAATGMGNADKAQVRLSLARIHGLEGIPTQPDAADAVAVAFCHLQQSRLRAATKEAAAR